MYITVINDCKDSNAVGRQSTRIAALFGISPTFVSVDAGYGMAGELEASGHLIDCLDASGGSEGIIIVNVAPRSKEGKKWPNGTPFGYFVWNNTLVISSVGGYTLSLLKKLKLINTIQVLDLNRSMDYAYEQGLMSKEDAERVKISQFRSFDFLPRAAFWLTNGHLLPADVMAASEIPDVDGRVWKVDNFGNCKTTMLESELENDSVETAWGSFNRYHRLKDVPDGEQGIIVGSSGIGEKRFIELVCQGSSVATRYEICQGDSMLNK